MNAICTEYCLNFAVRPTQDNVSKIANFVTCVTSCTFLVGDKDLMYHLQRVAKVSDTRLISLGNGDASTLQRLNDVFVDNICPIHRHFLPAKRIHKLVAILRIFSCIEPGRPYMLAMSSAA